MRVKMVVPTLGSLLSIGTSCWREASREDSRWPTAAEMKKAQKLMLLRLSNGMQRESALLVLALLLGLLVVAHQALLRGADLSAR